MPMITTGGANSSRMPSSEPMKMNENDDCSPVSAPASPRSSGRPDERQHQQVGAGAQQQLEQQAAGPCAGRTAGRRPRSPIDSAIMITPMMLVHTKVEVPKTGATRREAHSSTAMIDMPEQKARTWM